MDFEVTCDVAVAGAGIAGIAAAVQAARDGKRIILIEKTILPGGLATSGLINIYLPLCDGMGHQLSFGITEELFRRSIQYGPGNIPDWHSNGEAMPKNRRFRSIFSPAAFMLALDEFLIENKVDVWYDTRLCDVEKEGNKITAAIVENESGRGRIKAKCFIDASGSAIVARRAGIDCHDENNFLSMWAIDCNLKETATEVTDPEAQISGKLPTLGRGVQMDCYGVPWDVNKAPAGTVSRGISGKTVTRFVLDSRKMALDGCKKKWAAGCTKDDFYTLKLPATPQFRKIYGIDAAYVLDSGENNRHFDDSVGLCGDWRQPGPVWEIPYRALIPAQKTGGFLAAGRCIGARNDAWEVMRVIPVAGETGQVAGAAASLAIDSGVEPYELDVTLVQKKLRKLGFLLHMEEI